MLFRIILLSTKLSIKLIKLLLIAWGLLSIFFVLEPIQHAQKQIHKSSTVDLKSLVRYVIGCVLCFLLDVGRIINFIGKYVQLHLQPNVPLAFT